MQSHIYLSVFAPPQMEANVAQPNCFWSCISYSCTLKRSVVRSAVPSKVNQPTQTCVPWYWYIILALLWFALLSCFATCLSALTEVEKICKVHLLVLTSSDQLLFILKLNFSVFTKQYLNLEVNHTEPSTSKRVLCFQVRIPLTARSVAEVKTPRGFEFVVDQKKPVVKLVRINVSKGEEFRRFN